MRDIPGINLKRRDSGRIAARFVTRNEGIAQIIVHPVIMLAVEEEEFRRDITTAGRGSGIPQSVVPFVFDDVFEFRATQVDGLPQAISALEPLGESCCCCCAETKAIAPYPLQRGLGYEINKSLGNAMQIVLYAGEVRALLQGRNLEAARRTRNVADGGKEQEAMRKVEVGFGIGGMAVERLDDNVGTNGVADEDDGVVRLVIVVAVAP